MKRIGGVPDKAALLATSPLLRHLDREALRRLAAHARLERHRDGDMIFRRGDPGYSMLVVVEGQIGISRESAAGRKVVLNIIRVGEVVGEIALLDGGERTADAVAIGEVELLVLARRDFLPFLERHHDLCLRLLTVLCQRIRRTSEQVEDLVFLDQPARLAKALLRLASEQPAQGESGAPLIAVKLSQTALGALAGMRREAVNRQLTQWRQDGIIALDDRRIRIIDPDTLSRLAGSSL